LRLIRPVRLSLQGSGLGITDLGARRACLATALAELEVAFRPSPLRLRLLQPDGYLIVVCQDLVGS
jgi:hypothetical protein